LAMSTPGASTNFPGTAKMSLLEQSARMHYIYILLFNMLHD